MAPQAVEHPVFALGRKLDELFVQQYDRIGFHNEENENGYRRDEDRLDAELERLSAEKQRIIAAAASKGSTIEISSLRENMEKTKAEYRGADRAAYVRGIDAWIMKLEASYGTSIPIEDASRIQDELDQTLRQQGK